jgi:nicotinate-nucleotide adenylyltransferase
VSKLGIFGGTFDPIHLGHLITAQSVLEIRKLEKILFIPSYISPHKTDQVITEGKYRLKMVELAIEGNKHFEVSDYELNKKDISFTVETLYKVSQKYKNIELIIGIDNLLEFDTWKNPDKILELAKLVVLKRRVEDEKLRKNKFYKAADFVDTPLIEISSSEIRERVKNNLSIDFLVPSKVNQYIQKHNLYMD